MRPLSGLLLCALALGAAPVRALDLVQAWRAAQQQAPEAALADAVRDLGDARARQARALWRPNLAVEAGVAYASAETATRGAQFAAPGMGSSSGVSFDTSVTGGRATRYAVNLQQPLYSAERRAQQKLLDVAAAAAGPEREQIRQALMLRTAGAFFDVALAAARLQLLDRQLAAVRKAEGEARDRFDLGDRPVTDVHESHARAATLASERLAAAHRLQLAGTAFNDLTGLAAAPDEFRPPTAIPAADLGALDDWLARAEHASPALRLAQSTLDGAEAQAQASAGQFAPTVDLVGGIARERLSGSGDFGSASNTGSNRALGLRLSLPLSTSGMRSAQHAEGRAAVARARAELARLRQQVAQQVRAAWLELASGREEIEALDAAAEASRARLGATQLGLEAGDRTTLDLLNAENDTAAAALALMDARRRLTLRRLELAALAGELEEGLLERVNALTLGPP